VDEILTHLLIEMIETVFGEWINGLHHAIDGNGEYITQNIISLFLN
jgi:hypothetical protein